MFFRTSKLAQYRRSNYSNNFCSFLNLLQDIKNLRYLKYCTKRTSIQTFTTINTFRFINMFDSILILTNCFARANFFTRYWYIDNRMIWTILITFSTANTSVMVDLGFPVFLEMNSIFRTIHVTTSRYATTAQISYFIIDRNTRRTSLIYHTHQIFLLILCAFQCLTSIT